METTNQRSPSVIARDALRELARRKLAPTPDNYQVLYYEIAGVSPPPTAVPSELTRTATKAPVAAERIEPTLSAAPRTDLADPLKDMLVRAIEFATADNPILDAQLIAQGARLKEDILQAATADALKRLRSSVTDFWLKFERSGQEHKAFLAALIELLKLLSGSLRELIRNDPWLEERINEVQQLLEGQLNSPTLQKAQKRLTDIVFKQGMRKQTLDQAESAFKDMVAQFIDRLATITTSTGEYHEKLSRYSDLIQTSDGIDKLGVVISDLMSETRTMQADALRSRDELVEVRGRVLAYEERIRELEKELETMNELVKEDPLTHVLNRRGMHDAFRVELARCGRRGVPLSVAILDIDYFKRINDTHGHQIGDAVLGHLAAAAKETLRATDWIARYGGEEFVVLLPETPLDKAVAAVGRIAKKLLDQPWRNHNIEVAFTFSAGVVERRGEESEGELLARADKALYQAKGAGRNRIIADESH